MLGCAAGARLGVDYSRWFRLTYTRAGVGFDRFGGRKFPWLAFRHGKASMEYMAAERKRFRGTGDKFSPEWRFGKPWKNGNFSTKQRSNALIR